jgi:cell division protease FtsH
MARSMITLYGMSDKFGMVGLESVENRYLDGRRVLNCSEVTAAAIDEEVMRIMKECYDKAKGFLEENKDVMDRLAEFLYEKETITGKEFMKIFREMKGLPEEEKKKEDEGKRIL